MNIDEKEEKEKITIGLEWETSLYIQTDGAELNHKQLIYLDEKNNLSITADVVNLRSHRENYLEKEDENYVNDCKYCIEFQMLLKDDINTTELRNKFESLLKAKKICINQLGLSFNLITAEINGKEAYKDCACENKGYYKNNSNLWHYTPLLEDILGKLQLTIETSPRIILSIYKKIASTYYFEEEKSVLYPIYIAYKNAEKHIQERLTIEHPDDEYYKLHLTLFLFYFMIVTMSIFPRTNKSDMFIKPRSNIGMLYDSIVCDEEIKRLFFEYNSSFSLDFFDMGNIDRDTYMNKYNYMCKVLANRKNGYIIRDFYGNATLNLSKRVICNIDEKDISNFDVKSVIYSSLQKEDACLEIHNIGDSFIINAPVSEMSIFEWEYKDNKFAIEMRNVSWFLRLIYPNQEFPAYTYVDQISPQIRKVKKFLDTL